LTSCLEVYSVVGWCFPSLLNRWRREEPKGYDPHPRFAPKGQRWKKMHSLVNTSTGNTNIARIVLFSTSMSYSMLWRFVYWVRLCYHTHKTAR